MMEKNNSMASKPESPYGLDSIVVASGNSSYSDIAGVLFTKDKKTLIAYPPGRKGSYSISECVAAIANHAFRACLKLTTIMLPASVLSIGWKDFLF